MTTTFRTVPGANMHVALTATHRFVVERRTKGGFRMVTRVLDSGLQTESVHDTRGAAYKYARSLVA